MQFSPRLLFRNETKTATDILRKKRSTVKHQYTYYCFAILSIEYQVPEAKENSFSGFEHFMGFVRLGQ